MYWLCDSENQPESRQHDECLCDWANIIVALCSMYISMLLIAYLRWGKSPTFGGKFHGHNLRNLISIILLLVLFMELTDGLLSRAPASVLTVPSASAGFWASALILSHVSETVGRPRVLYVTATLLSANALSRMLRLVNLLQYNIGWEFIRPMAAALASGLYFILAVSEFRAVRVERQTEQQSSIPLATTSRYKHDGAHLLSKATFHWLSPLLRTGYSCLLEAEDLGALPEEHQAKKQLLRFQEVYQRQVSQCRNGLLALWQPCWLFTREDLLLGGLLKLLGDLLSLVPSLGITTFVNYIASGPLSGGPAPSHATMQEMWKNGWVVTAIVLVASLAQSTFSQASTHVVSITGIHLNAALQAKIYAKTLRLAKFQSLSDDPEVKEDESESGTATHLLTEDTSNIMSAVWIAHYVWAIPLKIALIMALLYQYLGSSALIGCAVTIFTVTPLQLVIGKCMSNNSAVLSDITDQRLQLVSSLIENMKLLKMLGWEHFFHSKIQKVRLKEEEKLNVDSLLWAAMTVLTHVAGTLIAVITLSVHSWISNEPISAATIFTALALFNNLTVPLLIFPVTVPIFISAAVSGKRIAKFLEQTEIEETLPKMNDTEGTLARTALPLHMLADEFSCENSVVDSDTVRYPESLLQEPDGIELDAIPPAPSSCDVTDVEAVSVEGVFRWPGKDSGWQLVLDRIVIPKGEMTIVVGNVGSGKSALFAAMLGEMQKCSGFVNWRRGTTVAYAGPRPWLVNATIRDNIIFGRSFRPRRYDEVIEACALKPDLDILPERDLTEVGEQGIHLSGGQRQRIGIARALYAHSNFVILDDPLSSLDQGVASQVFEAGIKRLVRRGRRTVAIVTHNLNLLPHSRKVIVMEEGRIRIQGQLNEIETLDTSLVAGWRSSIDRADLVQGRTARERWQLLRLVSSIGLDLKQNGFEHQQVDENHHHRRSTYRRNPPLSEWSFLSNDLPSPVEEVGVLRPLWRRHGGVRRRSLHMSRAFSLQSRPVRTHPVTRQHSSPLVLGDGAPRGSSRATLLRQMFKESNTKKVEGHRHQVLQRMSSTESGFSDAKSDIDPDEMDDVEVGVAGGGAEERQYGSVPRSVCFLYLTACGISIILCYAVFSVGWQAVRILTDGWLSRWTKEDENGEFSGYLWQYSLLSLLTLALSIASQWAGQSAGARARSSLHSTLLTHVTSCTVAAVASAPAGRFLNRFSADVTVIDKKLATCIQRLMQFMLMCASAIVVNAVVSPWFLLMGLPLTMLYYCVQRFYRTSSRELQRLDGIARSPVVSHLLESVTGLSTIRAYGYQHKFTSAFHSKLDQHTTAFIILNSSNRWLGIVLDYMGSVIVAVAMTTALVTSYISPGDVTPSLAGLAVNYTLLVPIYLNWVVKFISECEMYMGAVERIYHVLQLPTEKSYSGKGSGKWCGTGDILFENVTLRYSDTSDDVFVGLDLRIPAGQKVGICGRSGSGKSTLVLSLFRLLDPSAGRLLLSDADITELPPSVVRSHVAIVPQDAVLLPGSLRDNLDPGRQKSDSELWEALDAVKVRDLAIQHWGGLDGDMSTAGVSSGQRQLICLARALLRSAQVLVMDEATSSLDKQGEESLMSAAYTAFHGKTMIVIAHRLPTLLNCDRILVIDRGRIAEDGTPQQLLSKNLGVFSTMLKASEHNSIF